MTLQEAAMHAFLHFYHADYSNAEFHCAKVRFSPITFRLAEALVEADYVRDEVLLVNSHRGRYEEDEGR
jgi:hypothetical protein